jgi:hypothetical protein
MSTTGETLIVAVIVGAALWFTARRGWRAVQSARAKRGTACDTGCGCDTGAAAPPRDWAER